MNPYPKSAQVGRQAMDVSEFKKYTESEAALQRQCEEYLDLLRVTYLRFPDWLYRLGKNEPKYSREISRRFKGWPDLILFRPAELYPGRNVAVCVELKKKGGKLSGGQKAIGRRLNVIVLYSFESFKQTVDAFLK
jgi:hypothetical protein